VELFAEAEIVDPEREYSTLTGLQIRPANSFVEVRTLQKVIDKNHPTLCFSQARIDLAEANVTNLKRKTPVALVQALGLAGKEEIISSSLWIASVSLSAVPSVAALLPPSMSVMLAVKRSMLISSFWILGENWAQTCITLGTSCF
jgi:hypothetical protein